MDLLPRRDDELLPRAVSAYMAWRQTTRSGVPEFAGEVGASLGLRAHQGWALGVAGIISMDVHGACG